MLSLREHVLDDPVNVEVVVLEDSVNDLFYFGLGQLLSVGLRKEVVIPGVRPNKKHDQENDNSKGRSNAAFVPAEEPAEPQLQLQWHGAKVSTKEPCHA